MKTELESEKLLQPTAENRLLVLRCELTYHTLIYSLSPQIQAPDMAKDYSHDACPT